MIVLLAASATGVSARYRLGEAKSGRVQATVHSGLRIVGSAGETPPVVNEGGRVRLSVVDEAGVEVPVERWSSDSPEVARVTGRGLMKGRLFGYATIAATTSRGQVTQSAIVVRVAPSAGNGSRGDTEPDATGAVYLSSPDDHVVWRSSGVRDQLFVGRRHVPGFAEGVGKEARLHSPSGLSFDARQGGGLLVADAENHVIRLVRPEGATSTIIGEPMTAGRLEALDAPASEIRLDGPRGVVVLSGDLVVADTNNHQLLYVDRSRGLVSRLAGVAGEAGYVEGPGLAARFNYPTGIAASPDGRLLAVADPGNNRVRLVRLMRASNGRVEAIVSTAGVASSDKARGTGVPFRQPESVAFDPIGNLYVIDADGASVLTNLGLATEARSLLAQPGTFRDAASVAVRGARAVVLDAAAVNRRRALLSVTVGPPRIDALSRTSDSVAGGASVTIDGANFSPDAVVTLGDARVEALEVESARRVTFVVPRQGTNGARTLSVRTRGGLAQREFEIAPVPFASLTPGTIGTVGGSSIQPSGDGGLATAPGVFFVVTRMATDVSGSVVLVEGNSLRRIDSATGLISTIAGTGVPGDSGDGGPAVLAQFEVVEGIATDVSGNIFVADACANRIRRIDALTGTIATIAGTGEPGFSGDGGPAIEARFESPQGLAVDGAGGLLVADKLNNRIRRIDLATGVVTTIAGNGTCEPGIDGQRATEVGFCSPVNIAINSQAHLFIQNDAIIYRVEPVTGVVSRFAGTGVIGPAEEGMLALDAGLSVSAIASMPDGSVLVSDRRNIVVWRIEQENGLLERFAGPGSQHDGTGEHNGDGGPARKASIVPGNISADVHGGVFVADSGADERIRRVDPESGRIETIALSSSGELEPGRSATRGPIGPGLAMTKHGDFFVRSDNRILKWSTSDPVLRLVAGTGTAIDDGDGGAANEAGLATPSGVVAVNPSGGFAVVTSLGTRIRYIDPGGTIVTLAGTGEAGYDGDGGAATSARIQCQQVAFESEGVLYFSQYVDRFRAGYSTIRRVDPVTGRIETIAGSGNPDGQLGDGGDALLASFIVDNLVIAPDGDVIFLDVVNRRLRRIDRDTRTISTIVGSGETPGPLDDRFFEGQVPTEAPLSGLQGFAFDQLGRLVFIKSRTNSQSVVPDYRIVRIENVKIHIVSEHLSGRSADGTPLMDARFGNHDLVGILGDGSLVLVESGALRVVKGSLP